MFSLEFDVDKEVTSNKTYPVPFSSYEVSNIKIVKLRTSIFSQLSWDVPILHPARSNVILLLALPPDKDENDIITAIQRSCPTKSFSIFMLKHIQNSVLIEFGCQLDADKFYVKYLGTPFDRKTPHVNFILIFIYKVCSKGIPIIPIRTMKESECPEYELPLCPICFKLYDPLISGYFSPCGKDDVSDEAYRQWGSPDCPVCKTLHCRKSSAPIHCECGEKRKLWICMKCGHVGCERDSNKHAIEHFHKTKHRFAFCFDTMALWDYIGDRFVDRSYNTPPQSTEAIVDVYRDMLIDEIVDIGKKEDTDNKILDIKYKGKIEESKNELEKLTSKCKEMQEDFDEAEKVRKELESIKKKITELKNESELQELLREEGINKEREQTLKKIRQEQELMYRKLEERDDVSKDVICDFK